MDSRLYEEICSAHYIFIFILFSVAKQSLLDSLYNYI